MKKQILFNNFIAVIIHGLLCVVSFILFICGLGRGSFYLYTTTAIIYSLLVLGMYVLCGRCFLRPTYNLKNNFLSVGILALIIIVATVFASCLQRMEFMYVNAPFIFVFYGMFYAVESYGFYTDDSATMQIIWYCTVFFLSFSPSLAMAFGMMRRAKS